MGNIEYCWSQVQTENFSEAPAIMAMALLVVVPERLALGRVGAVLSIPSGKISTKRERMQWGEGVISSVMSYWFSGYA